MDIAREYVRISNQQDHHAANQLLDDTDKLLKRHDLNLLSSDSVHKKFACHLAKLSKLEFIANLDSLDSAQSYCDKLAEKYGFAPIKLNTKESELDKILIRYSDSRWWLRRIRSERCRAIDQIKRCLHLVSQRGETYCSNYAVNLSKSRKNLTRAYLESRSIENNKGQSFSLAELADRSVSNPRIRRAELMTRMRGFEEVAQHFGHVGAFITLTTPSRFDSTSTNGRANPKYENLSPKDAQDHLVQLWSLIRAKFDRLGIQPYGFRIVEPHHDGTPHWHLLLFLPAEQLPELDKTIRHYAFLDSPNESGAEKHRYKLVEIDPEKGSAAGYVAKYVSKQIDGAHIDEDQHGNNAEQSSDRINAWASTWNTRQFQQIGGPSVTLWRELRRLSMTESPTIEKNRKPADEGDWAAFVIAMGGPSLRRSKRPITTYPTLITHDGCRINRSTGELTKLPATKYGDKPLPKTEGINFEGTLIQTRKHHWHVFSKVSDSSAEVGSLRPSQRLGTKLFDVSRRSEVLSL